jgi:hypothetical protein
VAAIGAATVLSFAILAEYFPKELAGRANGALNLFHIAAAFAVSDGLCSQPRTSGRGMDLVHVSARQNRFATKAHARAVLEFKIRKALIQ